MIIHDVEQGSEEWLRLRLGIPTASRFKDILTSTGKLSASGRKYACELVSEIIIGRSMERDLSRNEDVIRGNMLEPQAVLAYEFEFGVTADKVGFITTDDGLIGISPDRLIGTDGMAEIKCPLPYNHIGYMIDGFKTDYWVQVQGQMAFADREWNDRVSYSPELSDAPLYRERTYRDEAYIKNLKQALGDFNEMKSEILHKVRTFGTPVEIDARTLEPAA